MTLIPLSGISLLWTATERKAYIESEKRTVWPDPLVFKGYAQVSEEFNPGPGVKRKGGFLHMSGAYPDAFDGSSSDT